MCHRLERESKTKKGRIDANWLTQPAVIHIKWVSSTHSKSSRGFSRDQCDNFYLVQRTSLSLSSLCQCHAHKLSLSRRSTRVRLVERCFSLMTMSWLLHSFNLISCHIGIGGDKEKRGKDRAEIEIKIFYPSEKKSQIEVVTSASHLFWWEDLRYHTQHRSSYPKQFRFTINCINSTNTHSTHSSRVSASDKKSIHKNQKTFFMFRVGKITSLSIGVMIKVKKSTKISHRGTHLGNFVIDKMWIKLTLNSQVEDRRIKKKQNSKLKFHIHINFHFWCREVKKKGVEIVQYLFGWTSCMRKWAKKWIWVIISAPDCE